jgi:hypothetical protein
LIRYTRRTSFSTSDKSERPQIERLDLQKSSPKLKKDEPTQVSMQASEQQDDLDMTKKVPTGSTSSDIGEQLTYS